MDTVIYGYGWWLRKKTSEKDWSSSVGMMTFHSQLNGRMKHVTNHQPGIVQGSCQREIPRKKVLDVELSSSNKHKTNNTRRGQKTFTADVQNSELKKIQTAPNFQFQYV